MKILLTVLFMVWLNLCLAQKQDAIHYTSLNKAIYLGHYDGTTKADELKRYGDFGLGSETRLASELVMLDGIMYSIPATGKLTRMNEQTTIAFSAAKFFKTEVKLVVRQRQTLEQLQHFLDSLIGPNRFAAIRINATFSSIRFRSFVEQQKPYKPLEEAEEIFFSHNNFKGNMVGFFTPKSAEAINSPVYHFHVVDHNRTTGGHVMDCIIDEATIELDFVTQLIVDLPDPTQTSHIDLNKDTKEKP